MKDQGRRRKFLVYTCALAFTTLVAFAIFGLFSKRCDFYSARDRQGTSISSRERRDALVKKFSSRFFLIVSLILFYIL